MELSVKFILGFLCLTVSTVHGAYECYTCNYSDAKCTGGDICDTDGHNEITGDIDCYELRDEDLVVVESLTNKLDKIECALGCSKMQAYYEYKVELEGTEYQYKINSTIRGCSTTGEPGCAYGEDLYDNYIKPNPALVWPSSYSGEATDSSAGCTCKGDLCNTATRNGVVTNVVFVLSAGVVLFRHMLY